VIDAISCPNEMEYHSSCPNACRLHRKTSGIPVNPNLKWKRTSMTPWWFFMKKTTTESQSWVKHKQSL